MISDRAVFCHGLYCINKANAFYPIDKLSINNDHNIRLTNCIIVMFISSWKPWTYWKCLLIAWQAVNDLSSGYRYTTTRVVTACMPSSAWWQPVRPMTSVHTCGLIMDHTVWYAVRRHFLRVNILLNYIAVLNEFHTFIM